MQIKDLKSDGLAISYRNRHHIPEQREKALQIVPFLFKSLTFVPGKSIQETFGFVKANLFIGFHLQIGLR